MAAVASEAAAMVDEDFPVEEIDSLRFGIFDAENPKFYHVHITSTKQLTDSRLGPEWRNTRDLCPSCRALKMRCPGHFGVIDFGPNIKLFNPKFLPMLVRVLTCVCLKCRRLSVVPPQNIKQTINAHLSSVYKRERARELDSRMPRLAPPTDHTEIWTRTDGRPARYDENGQPIAQLTLRLCGCIPGTRQTMVEITQERSGGAGSSERVARYYFGKWKVDARAGTYALTDKKGATVEVLPAHRLYDFLKSIDPDTCAALGFVGTRTSTDKTLRCEIPSSPAVLMIGHLVVVPPKARPVERVGQRVLLSTWDRYLSRTTQANQTLNGIDQRGDEQGVRRGVGDSEGQIAQQRSKATSNAGQYLGFSARGTEGKAVGAQAAELRASIGGITMHLHGKESLTRHNMQSKRTEYSSRAVIGPETLLGPEEVGISLHIARTMTFTEITTDANRQRLAELLVSGRVISVKRLKEPGSDSIKKECTIIFNRDDVLGHVQRELRNDDLVEREMMTGDPILINRQPTLHRPSIMCLRAVVSRNATNVIYLQPEDANQFNADFDGDEMNGILLQEEQARADAVVLMPVSQNICAPASGSPRVGPIQDTLLGAYLMTDPALRLSRDDALRLAHIALELPGRLDAQPLPVLTHGGPASYGRQSRLADIIATLAHGQILPKPIDHDGPGGAPRWSGAQILSIALPPGLEYNSHARRPRNKEEFYVVIENGQIVAGRVQKGEIGPNAANGLLRAIMKDYGAHTAEMTMFRLQRVACEFLSVYGFSLNVGDLLLPREVLKQVKQVVHDAQAVNMCSHESQRRAINMHEISGGLVSVEEQLEENYARSMMSNYNNKIADVVTNTFSGSNPLYQMYWAGSKGDKRNHAQMTGSVGQQVVHGKAPPCTLDGVRSTPYARRGSESLMPCMRGFIPSCYLGGLSFVEEHALLTCAREGLLDTSQATAVKGYLERRLIKKVEDIGLASDGTVSSIETGRIVQFAYGHDALDGCELELVKKLVDEVEVYGWNELARTHEVPRIRQAREWMSSILAVVSPSGSLRLPCDAMRILRTAAANSNGVPVSQEVAIAVEQAIEHALQTQLEAVCTAALVQRELVHMRQGVIIPTQLRVFIADIRAVFSSYNVCQRFHLGMPALENAIRQVLTTYARSLGSAGDMVGPAAAQSIGEQLTQFTLNTFHYSGSQLSATSGFNRFAELLAATKKPAVYEMRIPIRQETYAPFIEAALRDICSDQDDDLAAQSDYERIVRQYTSELRASPDAKQVKAILRGMEIPANPPKNVSELAKSILTGVRKISAQAVASSYFQPVPLAVVVQTLELYHTTEDDLPHGEHPLIEERRKAYNIVHRAVFDKSTFCPSPWAIRVELADERTLARVMVSPENDNAERRGLLSERWRPRQIADNIAKTVSKNLMGVRHALEVIVLDANVPGVNTIIWIHVYLPDQTVKPSKVHSHVMADALHVAENLNPIEQPFDEELMTESVTAANAALKFETKCGTLLIRLCAPAGTLALYQFGGIENVAAVEVVKSNGDDNEYIACLRSRVTGPQSSCALLKHLLATPNARRIGVINRLFISDPRVAMWAYGIRAARRVLIDESIRSIEFNNVDLRHLELIVDAMLTEGVVEPCTRHGQTADGPTHRIMTETPVKRAIEAGAESAVEQVRGVSASIMVGTKFPCGSNGPWSASVTTEQPVVKMEVDKEVTEEWIVGRICQIPIRKRRSHIVGSSNGGTTCEIHASEVQQRNPGITLRGRTLWMCRDCACRLKKDAQVPHTRQIRELFIPQSIFAPSEPTYEPSVGGLGHSIFNYVPIGGFGMGGMSGMGDMSGLSSMGVSMSDQSYVPSTGFADSSEYVPSIGGAGSPEYEPAPYAPEYEPAPYAPTNKDVP